MTSIQAFSRLPFTSLSASARLSELRLGRYAICRHCAATYDGSTSSHRLAATSGQFTSTMNVPELASRYDSPHAFDVESLRTITAWAARLDDLLERVDELGKVVA